MSHLVGRGKEKKNRPRGATQESRNPLLSRIYVVVLLLVLSVGFYLFQNGTVDVETLMPEHQPSQVNKIAIYGELEHVKLDQVRTLVRDSSRDGMLALDLLHLRDLLHGLPWVYRVRVRKVWPETVEVWLREQSAAVRWGDAGYLNLSGEFFRADGVLLEHLMIPLISSQHDDTEAVYRQFIQLSTLLDDSGQKIRKMVVDKRGSTYLYLENGVEINLGRRAMEQRLARWSIQSPVIMSQLNGEVGVVDLRYEQGMVINPGDRNNLGRNDGKL